MKTGYYKSLNRLENIIFLLSGLVFLLLCVLVMI